MTEHHRGGCVCGRRSLVGEGRIERQVAYFRGRDGGWFSFDADLADGSIKKPRRGRKGTWKGGIMLGEGKIEPLKLRLTESCDDRISEGLTSRIVIRQWYGGNPDLYGEYDFTARVIAATEKTVVLKPLVSIEEYWHCYCRFEGSGDQLPE